MTKDRKVDEFADLLPEDSTGFRIWRNPNNKVVSVELHYSADPEKRTRAWQELTFAGMPKKERAREYELSWETYGGKAVYAGAFSRRLHVWDKDQEDEPSLPLVRCWDSGGLPACGIGQWIGRTFTCLDEIIVTEFKSSKVFVPEVLEFCQGNYGPHTYIDIVDPAAFNEGKTVDETRVWTATMQAYGLKPIGGELLFQKRKDAVIELMTQNDGDHPRFMVNPRCQFTIAGCEGGYQYPEKVSERSVIRANKPLKNEYSHIQDAWQYAVSVGGKIVYKKARGPQVRTPKRTVYNFQRR